jgi:predicted nucleic acid-binding protein
MPDRLTISNTSPLLYLNLINRLELLQQMYGEIVIPPAVASELAVGASQGIAVPDPDATPWLHVVAVQSQALIPAMTDLGAGEAEVIGLALENPGSRVILDDQLARRVAALNRLTITGTVGVVLRAKQNQQVGLYYVTVQK